MAEQKVHDPVISTELVSNIEKIAPLTSVWSMVVLPIDENYIIVEKGKHVEYASLFVVDGGVKIIADTFKKEEDAIRFVKALKKLNRLWV